MSDPRHLGPYMDDSDIPPPPDGSGVVPVAQENRQADGNMPPPPPDGSGIAPGLDNAPVSPELVQANQLGLDDSNTLMGLYKHGSVHEILQFLESKGRRSDPAAVADYVHKRDTGQGVSYDLSYEGKPVEDQGGLLSAVRGGADTLSFGTAPKVAAAAKAVGQSLAGNGSFGENYGRNLDTNNAVVGMDEQNHPWTRLAGQLAGGLALPMGLEGVAARAEASALAAGRSVEEAHAIGMAAVRNRLTTTSAGYGAAHGAGSSDTLGDAAVNAGIEGGLGALTGRVLGSVGGKLTPKPTAVLDGEVSPATAADAAAIADKYNIPSTPATVGGAGAQAVQMGLGNLPGGMTAINAGIGRENQGVADAVRGIADNLGTVSTREGAGQAAVVGAKDYSAASRAEGAGLYKERDRLMGGDSAPVTLDDTQKQIADIAAKYPNSDTLAALTQHPVIRKLTNIADDASVGGGTPSELTLGEATDALSHVRGVSRKLATNGNDSDLITSRVGAVKDALTSDLYRAASAADQAAGREPGADGSAVAQQQKADAFWADRKQALAGTLKAPMLAGAKPTEMPAERVYQQIDTDTNLKGGNLARLRDTWFRLPPEARNTLAATKIDDMGRSLPGAQDNTGRAWSFDRYLTNFNTMSPQARNIMFGKDAASQLQEIAAYSSRLRQVGKSRNFSNTAKNYIAGALAVTVGKALLHGDASGALLDAAAIPGSYAAASLFLKTPAMRQWTVSALKAASSHTPERAENYAKAVVARLPAIAKAEPAIANEVMDLHQRLLNAASSAPSMATADQGNNEPAVTNRNAAQQQPAYQGATP